MHDVAMGDVVAHARATHRDEVGTPPGIVIGVLLGGGRRGRGAGARRRGRLPDRRASSIPRALDAHHAYASSSARNASRFASAAAASAAARGSNAYSTGSAPDMAKDFRGGRGTRPAGRPYPPRREDVPETRRGEEHLRRGDARHHPGGRRLRRVVRTLQLIVNRATRSLLFQRRRVRAPRRRARRARRGRAYAAVAGAKPGPRRRPGRRCYRPTTGTFEDRRRRGSRRPDRGPARG